MNNQGRKGEIAFQAGDVGVEEAADEEGTPTDAIRKTIRKT